MSTPPRSIRIGCLALLVVIGGCFVWGASDVVRAARYNHFSHRINLKIVALRERRPADVSEDLWDECVAWASIAHCNICFSETHTNFEAVCRFEEQLDTKLQGDIDLSTIEWIGDRLAETGPHGQRYMEKWRVQWQDMLRYWEAREAATESYEQ